MSHFSFINDLVQKHNLKIGAELGVREGLFTEYLLSRNPDLFMYAVDAWEALSGMCFNDLTRDHNANLYAAIVRFKPFDNRAFIIKDSTVNAAKFVIDNSLDFIFIDASHDYESCKADIKAWYPKVKDGGWITGHDYHPGRGVKQAVDELCKDFEIGGTVNTTWICKKANVI